MLGSLDNPAAAKTLLPAARSSFSHKTKEKFSKNPTQASTDRELKDCLFSYFNSKDSAHEKNHEIQVCRMVSTRGGGTTFVFGVGLKMTLSCQLSMEMDAVDEELTDKSDVVLPKSAELHSLAKGTSIVGLSFR